ncbi:MAG: serine/threonine protein kinase [Chloroflexota bacterium]
MKRICQKCNVISQDLNLWCQEKDCPAENATEIFDNGEWFGPIEIIQPVVINRSAIVYQARRGSERILLKVANPGCEEKLRSEARAFLQLAKAGQHPLLPVLLAAHPQGKVENYPYGWIVIQGRVKYYEVFAHADGEILRTLMLKNPQPWYQHVGWIVLSVADVIIYLHKANKLHLCINPDVILLRFDKQGIPRPLLIDLGVSAPGPNIQEIWDHSYNLPAYTAPEIVNQGAVSAATDVYGLGMLLYELLAGHPAYAYHLKKDHTVYQNVIAGHFAPTERIDLKNIPQIAEKAIQMQPGQRYANVVQFAGALSPNLPAIPAERKARTINWRVLFIILAALLAISMLLVLAVSVVPT